MSEVALALEGVQRRYQTQGEPLQVLRGVDLAVRRGEMVALVAPSGAGKSTLLHVAGLLEQPDGGRVRLLGEDATGLSDSRRTALRSKSIGFVYQFHHLLPDFSALENVVLPQMLAGVGRSAAAKRAKFLLEQVGLGGRIAHRPGKLSGGEQQRVAIVRALANSPGVLLADEPTGNLDPTTADGVFEMLRRMARETNSAALIATHNLDLAARMDRTVTLRDGKLVEA
ncbi:MAG: ABC transporter ATP-binding protein [Elsteraceae bacterium]